MPSGKPCKHTIGAYPAIDLASARRLGGKALSAVAEGANPAADKKVARQAARKPANSEMVEKVVERFIDRHAKAKTRESTWKEAERILNLELVKRWKGKSLRIISRSDIHAVLDDIVDRGAPIAANRSLAVMSRFFNWAVEREIIAASPCVGIKAPSAKVQRDRVLGDDELRVVWKAADRVGWPFGPIVQLLILTGQRRDEVAGMSRHEINAPEKLWSLPRGRVKNDKGHVVPLSPQAITIINEVPRIDSERNFLFTTTGRSHVSGFAKLKERIDDLVGEFALRDELGVVPHWTLHDLRRTFASGCARLGFAPQIVEAILNHKSGTIRGVAAVYNRYNYAAEKRAALDAWARHVEALVSDKPRNVVQLRERSA